MPAARAMSSVEAPWSPLRANSTVAASSTAARRSSAVWRGAVDVIVVSIHSQDGFVKGEADSLTPSTLAVAYTNRVSAAATRSHSASVIVVANGSASARANARSAPGNEPRSR